MRFQDINLKGKMIVGNAASLLLFVILAVIVYSGLNSLLETNKWVDHTHTVMREALDIQASAVDMETGMRGFLLAGRDQFLEPYVNGKQQISKQFNELKETVNDNPAQVKRLDEAQDVVNDWITNVTEPMIAMRRQVGDSLTMQDVVDEVAQAKGKQYFDRFRELISEFVSVEQRLLKEREAEAESTTVNAELVLIIGTIVAVGLSLLVSFLLANLIVRALKRGVGFAHAVSMGDFSQRLKLQQKDEVGELAEALDDAADSLQAKAALAEAIAKGDLTRDVELSSDKDMLGKALHAMNNSLNRTMAAVKETAVQVAAGASQLMDSSQGLSQGATEQAATLEEITSSMSEIGSQTRSNAENAGQANRMAEEVKQAADQGNTAMQRMIGAMQDITESSKSIEKIIKVIDEIAFQTNLLALNAAVEAARAGQHGKGFAVVAEEVRNLAGRSAQAAQETAELIEGTIGKVDNGSTIADETSEALSGILETAGKAADLISEIAAASNEQAQGIAQVNEGLSQVDQVTQRNTSNSEETASASEELAGRAAQLQEVLTMFKIKADGRVATPAAGTTPAPKAPAPRKSTTTAPAPKPENQVVRPQDVINLDDDEFGKY